jgi:predicted lipid carrier protein YhbT
VSAGTPREFFADLATRAPAAPDGLRGSYRFDVAGAGSWRVDVRDDGVAVTESSAPADCVIAADEATFMRVLTGQASPVFAFMTGKLRVEGDMGLALRLRDLFA